MTEKQAPNVNVDELLKLLQAGSGVKLKLSPALLQKLAEMNSPDYRPAHVRCPQQDICILCDSSDICRTCDAMDWCVRHDTH